MLWNILVMLNGLYSALAYPYFIVNGLPQFNDYAVLFLVISEIIFFIDIVLSFFKQDMDEEGKSKFDKLEFIAKNYFYNKFIIDFIAFLPIGYFFTQIDQKLKFFWVIKTLRIRNLNHQISDTQITPIVNDFIKSLQKTALNDPEMRKDTLVDRIYV